MSILSYLADLLPTFGKKDIVGKLKIIARKLTDIVRPELALISESLNDKELRSTYGKSFLKDLNFVLPPNLRNMPGAYVKMCTIAVDHGQRLVDLLEQYVAKAVGETVHIEGITYQKASVLRLIDLIDFFADYSSRHMAFLVASETNIEAFGNGDGNPFTPKALAYLTTNRESYLRVMNLLNADPKKLMSDIEKIPEITVSDADIKEVPALAGAAADPLQLGAIPIITGMFTWYGIRKVDWEIERYEAMKGERRSMENRLESLRQKRIGQIDAQNEVVIEGYERELILTRASIEEMERKLK